MARVVVRRWVLRAAGGLLAAGKAVAEPAERRIALVIGNNAYKNVNPLRNAGNDARAMTAELAAHGFKVIPGYDLDRSEMLDLVESFRQQLPGYDFAVFYYAGHGVQINGSNYLIPVNIGATLTGEQALIDRSVDLSEVTQRMAEASPSAFRMLIIDACRDNPFSIVGKRSIGVRRGLAPPAQANGMMILYSAASNQEALDSLGSGDSDPNSVFTRELLKAMRQAGVSVKEMVSQLGDAVYANTNHEQNPAVYDESRGRKFFTPLDGPAIEPQPVHLPQLPPSPPAQLSSPQPAPQLVQPQPSSPGQPPPPQPPVAATNRPAPTQARPTSVTAVAPRLPSPPRSSPGHPGAQHNPNNVTTSLGVD